MTTTLDTIAPAIHHEKILPEVYKLLRQVHEELAKTGFDRALAHLILLRASQINGCGFCVEMHTREARADGETSPRLDQLIVWRHAGLFSPAVHAHAPDPRPRATATRRPTRAWPPPWACCG